MHTRNTAIHQLVAGHTNADAISNEAREYRRVFRSWGCRSDIFSDTRRILPELRKQTFNFNDLGGHITPRDTVVLHLSIGSPVNEYFRSLNCRKVIRYHNVTPGNYFELINRNTAINLANGRKQVASLAGSASLSLAVSEFNARELENAGYENVRVLPILLDMDQVTITPDRRIIKKFGDDICNILFVGRCAPNKRIEDLIEAMAYLRKASDLPVRLVHVGSFAGTERYYHLLLSLRRDLNLDREVHFAGSVNQKELSAFYRSASVFLCMSEHEGFCIPLLESMAHKVPVVAYSAGAVPETLGGAGVLVKEKNYPLIAETVNEILVNRSLRESIVNKQNERLSRYLARDLSEELKSHLDPLLHN
jgi:glycosyltransferase involved in cell wall biosynthesis